MKTEKKEQLDLSIIVVSGDRKHLLSQCLKSIQHQSLAPAQYEVIVCPPIKGNNTPYVSEQRNIGIQKSKGHILLLLDEDCELPNPDSLKQILNLHFLHNDFTLIGGHYKDHPSCSFWGKVYNEMSRRWQQNGSEDEPHLLGGCLSFKKALLPNLEPFSKSFLI